MRHSMVMCWLRRCTTRTQVGLGLVALAALIAGCGGGSGCGSTSGYQVSGAQVGLLDSCSSSASSTAISPTDAAGLTTGSTLTANSVAMTLTNTAVPNYPASIANLPTLAFSSNTATVSMSGGSVSLTLMATGGTAATSTLYCGYQGATLGTQSLSTAFKLNNGSNVGLAATYPAFTTTGSFKLLCTGIDASGNYTNTSTATVTVQ